jgi:hypothetical protein
MDRSETSVTAFLKRVTPPPTPPPPCGDAVGEGVAPKSGDGGGECESCSSVEEEREREDSVKMECVSNSDDDDEEEEEGGEEEEEGAREYGRYCWMIV